MLDCDRDELQNLRSLQQKLELKIQESALKLEQQDAIINLAAQAAQARDKQLEAALQDALRDRQQLTENASTLFQEQARTEAYLQVQGRML